MKTCHLICLVICALACPGSADAALSPAESDAFVGQAAPPWRLRDLTGEQRALGDFAGRPLLLVFCATWCPPCRQELGELSLLHQEYGDRVGMIATACDGVVFGQTPSAEDNAHTLKEASNLAATLPIPFPVVIPTREFADSYHFKGIPTLVFIDGTGRLGRVFYGLHDVPAIRSVVESLLATAASKPAADEKVAPVMASNHGPGQLFMPFITWLTDPPKHWHPMLVHFPIVFIVLEMALLAWFLVTRKPEFEQWAYRCLKLAVVTTPIIIVAGIHDAGLDLGAGNPLWLGLLDRWHNGAQWGSSITIHQWIGLCVWLLVLLRWMWHWRCGPIVLQGWRGRAYSAMVVLGVWCMLATASVGGHLSHS